MATLPALGASADFITTCGFSSGSFMSAQLLIGFPETFRCGGLLNGGLTFAATLGICIEGQENCTQKTPEQIYKGIVDTLDSLVGNGIPDQSLLAKNAVYIFGSDDDMVVPITLQDDQERYFKSKNAKVTFEKLTGYGHFFDMKNAPKMIANTCNSGLDTGREFKEFDWTMDFTKPIDTSFLTKGAWRKFDQYKLAKDAGVTNTAELGQWGYYYVPTACQTQESNCPLQLVLHGHLMNVEREFAESWSSYAAANDVILILPQANEGWSYIDETDPTANRNNVQWTTNGRVMKFMKQLVTQATKTKRDSFEADMNAGEYEFGYAYPVSYWKKKYDSCMELFGEEFCGEFWGDEDKEQQKLVEIGDRLLFLDQAKTIAVSAMTIASLTFSMF